MLSLCSKHCQTSLTSLVTTALSQTLAMCCDTLYTLYLGTVTDDNKRLCCCCMMIRDVVARCLQMSWFRVTTGARHPSLHAWSPPPSTTAVPPSTCWTRTCTQEYWGGDFKPRPRHEQVPIYLLFVTVTQVASGVS